MTQLVIYAPQLHQLHGDHRALQPWLRYGDRLPVQAPEGLMRTAYWLHQSPPVPWAALTAAEDLADFDPHRFYLRMDPVHLHPDRDTLVLFRAEALGLNESEAAALFDAFNDHFSQEGVALSWGHRTRWYLSLPQPIDLHTVPLADAEHANLHAVAMRGETVSQWNRLLTEAQMLFYQHPVNTRRREENLPEINSLWPWGEGIYSHWQRTLRPHAAVYTSDETVQALARQINARVLTTPELDAASSTDFESLLLDWQALSPDWVLDQLEQAVVQLKNGCLTACVLDVGSRAVLSLRPDMLRRFWRRWGPPRHREILNSGGSLDLEHVIADTEH